MNIWDIIILLLFIPGIVRGLSKGFLEQGLSLAGIVLAVWMAFHFSGKACQLLQQHITVPDAVLRILGFVVVLVIVLIGVLLLAKLATKVVEMATLGWLNKALGLFFALATTALVLALLAILLDTLNLRFGLVKSPSLQESVLYGYLKDLGYFVFPYLKQWLTPTAAASAIV
jgi:membrane protein required for colicin V production